MYDSLYNGETYDSRKEIKGWNAPGFDDSDWLAASAAATDSASTATLSSQLFEPIREISELKPVEITEPKPGMFVVDFGQNIAGFVRITMRDTTAGQNVTLRFSELKMHPPYGAVDGTLYYGNLRGAKATDTYIAAGGEQETYQPTFTQHGFRFCEVQGLSGKVG